MAMLARRTSSWKKNNEYKCCEVENAKVFDFTSIGKWILLHCVIKDGYIALVAIKEEATSAIKHLHYWQDTFCRFSIPPILN